MQFDDVMQFDEEESKEEIYNAQMLTFDSDGDSEDFNDSRSSISTFAASTPYVNHNLARKPTRSTENKIEKMKVSKKHVVQLTDE